MDKYAVAIIAGTTIGAGILGLPKAIVNAGIVKGIAIIFFAYFLTLIINLAIGEALLRTRDYHQLPGLAKRYLGNTGKNITLVIMLLSIYGSMIAYMVGISSTLSSLLPLTPPHFLHFIQQFGPGFIPQTFSYIIYGIIIWGIVTIILSLGIKKVGASELGLLIPLLILVLTIVFLASPKIDISNFLINGKDLFGSYGVALFAFMGLISIPVARELLRGKEKELRSSIIAGTTIPLIIYLLFALIVVGVTGIRTTDVATIALGESLGSWFLVYSNLFAILAMLTSFIALSNAALETYVYDYKIKKGYAITIVMAPLLALFLILRTTFLQVLSFTGAFNIGLLGILTLFIYHNSCIKGNRKPEYTIGLKKPFIIILSILLIIGIVGVITSSL